MDPVIEEICRARGPEDIRPSKLRDWQQYLKHDVQARLDALERLTPEVEALRTKKGRG
jgi:hypothetical protein